MASGDRIQDSMRPVHHRLPTARVAGKSRSCEACGCSKRTKKNKPFCLDHLHLNPHARKVLSEQGTHWTTEDFKS